MSNECETYIGLLNNLFHRFTTTGTYNDIGFFEKIIKQQLSLINKNTNCTKDCKGSLNIISHRDGTKEDLFFHLKQGYKPDKQIDTFLKTILANHRKICSMGFFTGFLKFNNNQVKSQSRSSRASRSSRRARNRSRKAKSRRVNRLRRSRN
jgi:hypothetical protein